MNTDEWCEDDMRELLRWTEGVCVWEGGVFWSSDNLWDDDADDYDSQHNTDHSQNDLLLQRGVETESACVKKKKNILLF